MARKTFISYKFSEASEVRDRIVEAMGQDAIYYQGETSESPDLTDCKTSTIKRNLSDMIFNTSVTIVVISPEMNKSKWIDWEISYSLRQSTRDETTSHTNGIVGVVMKVDGGYDWFIHNSTNCHNQPIIWYDSRYEYEIITKNRYNSQPPKWHCKNCHTYDRNYGSYISYVKEDVFLKDPSQYIEIAYNKSKQTANYEICVRI